MTDLNALESIYFAALEKPAADRPKYLDAACGGNAELRACVERLLAAEPNLGGFLDAPSPAAAIPAPDTTAAFGSPPDGGTRTFRAAADSPTAHYPGKDSHVGAIIAGKYILVEVVGEGGMGSVWRAKQTEPVKRFVAVKLIKAGMAFQALWTSSGNSIVFPAGSGSAA